MKQAWNEWKSLDLVSKLLCTWVILAIIGAISGIINSIFSD